MADFHTERTTRRIGRLVEARGMSILITEKHHGPAISPGDGIANVHFLSGCLL